MSIVNVNLLKHPLNWVIILLMLIIAGAAGHMILQRAGFEPAAAEQ